MEAAPTSVAETGKIVVLIATAVSAKEKVHPTMAHFLAAVRA
jgi:hypothetical protein